MSRCVPCSWDVLEDDHNLNLLQQQQQLMINTTTTTGCSPKPSNLHGPNIRDDDTKYAWDKPRAAETLETIVNHAATLQPDHCKPPYADELVPWMMEHHSSAAVTAGSAATMTMDALVPNSGTQAHALLCGTNGSPSTMVGSCSSGNGDHMVAAVAAREWSSCGDQSVSGSETFGQLTAGVTRKRGFGVKLTFSDEHDSVCHSRPQIEQEEKNKASGRSSISIKRSRAAVIHNQSERRRRDKISEKMKTLRKLVPNANKTDKASMLDEVIEYLKQLQAQINMMGRMSMSPIMMSLAMRQQQLQMAMMNNHMRMGMGIPHVMDLNAIGPNIPGMLPLFHPPNIVQPMMAPWDMHGTRDQAPNHNDPMANFLACQSRPMTMECYNSMATLYKQMHNQPRFSGPKN